MMNWRHATVQDVPQLAKMNLHLIEDEGARNPMDETQLGERMLEFLESDYTAVVFSRENQVIGYALFRPEDDHIYLRQFFVERGSRGSGLGREAFEMLKSQVLPDGKRLVVSVLATNPGALAFWRSVGFSDYCSTLEILPD